MATSEARTACDWAQERLEAYLDGELAAQDRDGVERHLVECPGCSEDLAFAHEIQTGLRGLPKLVSPDTLIRRIEIIPSRNSSNRVLPRWIGWTSLAAAASISILVAMNSFNESASTLSVPPAPVVQSAELERAELEVKATLAYLARVTHHSTNAVPIDAVQAALGPPLAQVLGFLTNSNSNPTHEEIDNVS